MSYNPPGGWGEGVLPYMGYIGMCHCEGYGRGGEGVLPYMGYIGMCHCEGYGFQAVSSRIEYINQNIWV